MSLPLFQLLVLGMTIIRKQIKEPEKNHYTAKDQGPDWGVDPGVPFFTDYPGYFTGKRYRKGETEQGYRHDHTDLFWAESPEVGIQIQGQALVKSVSFSLPQTIRPTPENFTDPTDLCTPENLDMFPGFWQ